MPDIRRSRSIFEPQQHEHPVLIAGCGATGSHVALLLASLGVQNITCVDFDTVSEHNLTNQVFGQKEVGNKKVFAMINTFLWKFGKAPDDYRPIMGRLPESFALSAHVQLAAQRKGVVPILFLCVDSMEARQEIVNALVDYAGTEEWYVIDTRMAAAHGNVFGFKLSERAKWEATLIRDEDAEASPCGAVDSVIPTVQVISGLAVWEYIKFCTDPEALEGRLDIFLKPTALNAGKL